LYYVNYSSSLRSNQCSQDKNNNKVYEQVKLDANYKSVYVTYQLSLLVLLLLYFNMKESAEVSFRSSSSNYDVIWVSSLRPSTHCCRWDLLRRLYPYYDRFDYSN
jgi:hypothetical protein